MNEYLISRLSDLRIQDLRREAEVERIAAQARIARRQSESRLKPPSRLAWYARWRARIALS